MEFEDFSKNFLGIQQSFFYNFKDASTVILPLPFERSSSYGKGSVQGPQAIIQASHFIEYYDEFFESETYRKGGICTLSTPDFKSKKSEEVFHWIENKTRDIVHLKKFFIALGGEHSISFPIVKGFNFFYKDLSVLQLDAHADLRDSYGNNPFSHACVMKRIFQLGNTITQVGVRALSKQEADLIKNSESISTFYDHTLNMDESSNQAILNSLNKYVYITIDTDVFSPMLMPATGTPEPGGLQWEETLGLLKKIFENKQVVGIDIVECAPIKSTNITQYNLAKLIYRLIGFHYHKQ